MKRSLHYLLMANHTELQKQLFSSVKDTELTLGQPKVLDYLKERNGVVQKEIACACHIEPASLSSILNGMEKKGLITRKMSLENRRVCYIFLTEKGERLMRRVDDEFKRIDESCLYGFSEKEKETLNGFLERIYNNLYNVKSTKGDNTVE
ncbi:MAG: MarR family transcriptional regulator [Clostridiales bacterium]|nr:MarR family transcriptional regulator [Clostridiales bacterium]